MLDLRIVTGGSSLPIFDLPAALGRAGAAKEISDQIDALINFLDDLSDDPDLEDGDEDRCMAGDDGTNALYDTSSGTVLWGYDDGSDREQGNWSEQPDQTTLRVVEEDSADNRVVYLAQARKRMGAAA